jgi:hypothetical protein
MVLNMAQTWHQLRPGEIRNDCGGCHAHSQKPTDFNLTAAAKPDYQVFDLTRKTPLLTSKKEDQSGKKWDDGDRTGLRLGGGVLDVEYHRDVRPIFERSCVACHTQKADKPAGKLVLDDDRPVQGPRWDMGNAGMVPATYNTLAGNYLGITRYVRGLQARRSLLVWKVFGRRTDGFPAKALPGREEDHKRVLAQGDFTGSAMPPPEAVAAGKVRPLSDEDRRTLVRWIDLGCPVDLAFDPKEPTRRGDGWLFDDQRPTLALTYPQTGANSELSRILIGMHDYNTGLDPDSFEVRADFPLDGVAAGENLAPKFRAKEDGVWEWTLSKPLTALSRGTLTISVKDRQGNVARIERTFSVAASK